MPLIVGEEGGRDESALAQPVDHRAIAGAAFIDRPDAEFGLHPGHFAQQAARPFADGKVMALRVHLQEGPGKAMGAPQFRQQAFEAAALHLDRARHLVALREDRILFSGRLLQGAELIGGHDVEAGRAVEIGQRHVERMPFAVGRGASFQFSENIGIGFEGQDRAPEPRILAQHRRILAAIGADVEHAIHREGAQKPAQRLDFGILMDPAAQCQTRRQRPVAQFTNIAAHALATLR